MKESPERLGYSEFQCLLDCLVRETRLAFGDRLVSIVLYGSVARGEAGPQSDLDILVIIDKAPPSYYERLRPLLPILRNLHALPCWKALRDRGIYPSPNVLLLSREEAEQDRCLYLDMIEEGRMLADRGGFFRGRLEALRSRLRDLGATKKRHNGGWFWDLKPDLHPGEDVVL